MAGLIDSLLSGYGLIPYIGEYIFENSGSLEDSFGSGYGVLPYLAGQALQNAGQAQQNAGQAQQNAGQVQNFIPAWVNQLISDNRAAQMAAALQQQSWQDSSAQKVMDFNAEQSRLNWERQSQANQIAMDFSAEQAQLNRDFINDQRATAYQAAMADAKAAGLNPILAASQGGAGVVSGAIASGVSTGGSAASMQSLPNGSKADTDITTLSHLISNVTSGAFQIGGDLIGILASILTKGKSNVIRGFR